MAKDRVCPVCKKSFEPDCPSRYYCGEECAHVGFLRRRDPARAEALETSLREARELARAAAKERLAKARAARKQVRKPKRVKSFPIQATGAIGGGDDE